MDFLERKNNYSNSFKINLKWKHNRFLDSNFYVYF